MCMNIDSMNIDSVVIKSEVILVGTAAQHHAKTPMLYYFLIRNYENFIENYSIFFTEPNKNANENSWIIL